MDRRFFVTLLVCFAIYFTWNAYFMPPPKKKPAPSSQPVAAAPASQQAPAAVQPASIAAAPASAPIAEDKRVELSTPDYTAQLSTIGASLTSFTLSGYKEAHDPKADKRPVNLVGADTRAISVELNEQPFPFATGERTSNTEITFSGDVPGLQAKAVWKVGKDYGLTLDTKFTNTGGAPIQVVPRVAVRGLFNERAIKDKSFLAPPPDILTAMMETNDGLSKHAQGKKDTPEKNGGLKWVGVDRQYFLIAAAPQQSATGEFTEGRKNADFLELSAYAKHDGVSLEPGKSVDYSYKVFAGPKVAKLLKEQGTGVDDAIDYTSLGLPLGFLARPMLWILNQAFQLVGSYGWAIAILTLIVKLLLLPITQKSFVSMQVMKEMKPDLDRIKERFPNDREKQGMETMRLYKERGVNPFLGGCVPALLQMPVYFALWRTLWAAVELYQQEFLWFKDLTQPDPYFIVPALLGVTMYFQQKLSPPAGDPQQQKIMLYMMPPLMTSFMLFLPSGLVFYIFINTILTILQQTYISRKFAKKPA